MPNPVVHFEVLGKDAEALQATIEPWEQERNERHATVNWRFAVLAARTKLVRLYPQNHDD